MCDINEEYYDQEVGMMRSCQEVCDYMNEGEDYEYDNMECEELCPHYLLCLETTSTPSTSTLLTSTTSSTTTSTPTVDNVLHHLNMLDKEYTITLEAIVAICVVLTVLIVVAVVIAVVSWRKYRAISRRDHQMKSEISRSENLESDQLLSMEDDSDRNSCPSIDTACNGNSQLARDEQDQNRLSTQTIQYHTADIQLNSDCCAERSAVELSDRCLDTSHTEDKHRASSLDCVV